MHPTHLNIGVFLPSGVQLLDLSPIDLFAMLHPDYLTVCNIPSPLIAHGIPSTIYCISLPSTTHVTTTANIAIPITHSINSPEVQPGKLDILLIPGPDPSTVFGEEVLGFVKGHVDFEEKGKRCDVLSVCTGAFVLGQAGVLEGRRASGPRALVPELRKKWPGTKWVDDRRWVVDRNVWTSGGITNGQEMVAGYMREKFPGPTTDCVLAMADVGEKGIEYPTGKARETVWWLWQILRAVGLGIGTRKAKTV